MKMIILLNWDKMKFCLIKKKIIWDFVQMVLFYQIVTYPKIDNSAKIVYKMVYATVDIQKLILKR